MVKAVGKVVYLLILHAPSASKYTDFGKILKSSKLGSVFSEVNSQALTTLPNTQAGEMMSKVMHTRVYFPNSFHLEHMGGRSCSCFLCPCYQKVSSCSTSVAAIPVTQVLARGCSTIYRRGKAQS